MAPIRRYLRITKYSVLEVRIYLHKPSDASWLLSSRDNVLERIIQEVRPKVLPKLREENENAKKKSARKKRITKDVAAQEDFEVAIFLKENSTRHSLLTKHKKFADKPRIRSTGSKLTGWLEKNNVEHPIRIEEDEEIPEVLIEEGNDDVVELKDIPEVHKGNSGKKRRAEDGGGEEEDDALFVSSSDEEFFATQRVKSTQPSKKRRRDKNVEEPTAEHLEEQEQDDKKKLHMDTSYDGFSIYGRILCLIVTRKGKKDAAALTGGSEMMENWVSTQAAQEAGILDDDG